jgi:hypothetical protein
MNLDASLVEALVRSRKLSAGGARGLVAVVAATYPHRMVDLADRADIDMDTDMRASLVRAARRYDVVAMLESWPADVELVDTAVTAHGSLPELVVYCGRRGWLAKASELAAVLEHEDAARVPGLWERRVGGTLPDDVRLALIDALMVETDDPVPNVAGMNKYERHDAFERIKKEREILERRLWELLEPAPHLWTRLVQDSRHATFLRLILLESPLDLTDDLVIACLPAVSFDASQTMRRNRLSAGVRLSSAAFYVRRRPRLRVLAAEDLRRVVREAVEDGWTPGHDLYGPDWSGIADLAVLTDDTALLAKAAAAAATIERRREPSWPYRSDESDQTAQRADAVLALVANEATPRSDLVRVLPTLDEDTLGRVLEQSDGDLAEACRAQLDRLRREAAQRQPKRFAVPGDDELAQAADPVAELRKHLRHLRGPAAQRDLTSDGLLRSRYTTRELLEPIRARHVLGCAERADQVADLIIEICGDQDDRWQALAAVANTKPAPAMTFGAWLAQLTAST